MSNYLEYDESEMDDPSIGHNPAQPISGPSSSTAPTSASAPRPMQAIPLRSSVSLNSVDPRLAELREMKRPKLVKLAGKGVVSLKEMAMAVVKVNVNRITDIGILEYYQVKEFIDELEMLQLSQLEDLSPHIKKDTDWLWEYFLLLDYPVAHRACRIKDGEPRTSGWRRSYKRAAEETRQRQEQAAKRLAERYAALAKEQAAKKTVLIDYAIPEKKGRRNMSTSPTTVKAGSGLIGKARADAHRARISNTHLHGKIQTQPTSTTRRILAEGFMNPYKPKVTTLAPVYTPNQSKRYVDGIAVSTSGTSGSAGVGGRPQPRPVDGPKMLAPRPTPKANNVGDKPKFNSTSNIKTLDKTTESKTVIGKVIKDNNANTVEKRSSEAPKKQSIQEYIQKRRLSNEQIPTTTEKSEKPSSAASSEAPKKQSIQEYIQKRRLSNEQIPSASEKSEKPSPAAPSEAPKKQSIQEYIQKRRLSNERLQTPSSAPATDHKERKENDNGDKFKSNGSEIKDHTKVQKPAGKYVDPPKKIKVMNPEEYFFDNNKYDGTMKRNRSDEIMDQVRHINKITAMERSLSNESIKSSSSAGSGSSGSSDSSGSSGNVENNKRKRADEVEVDAKRVQLNPALGQARVSPPTQGPSQAKPTGNATLSIAEKTRLESVLFRKKKPIKR